MYCKIFRSYDVFFFPLKVCDMLACHNYWHWALYNIEKVKGGNIVTSRTQVTFINFFHGFFFFLSSTGELWSCFEDFWWAGQCTDVLMTLSDIKEVAWYYCGLHCNTMFFFSMYHGSSMVFFKSALEYHVKIIVQEYGKIFSIYPRYCHLIPPVVLPQYLNLVDVWWM